MKDSYGLNASPIVGPPYAITEIIPNLGQLTDGTQLVLKEFDSKILKILKLDLFEERIILM